MHIDNSETGHLQQRLPQNVAARKKDQVRRPVLKLRDGMRRILVIADGNRETINFGNFADTPKHSVFVFEQRAEISILHFRQPPARLRDELGTRVATDLNHTPLAKLAKQGSAIQ